MKEKLLLCLLKGVALLPLKILYLISDFIYMVIYHFIGYRKKVVHKNLMEAFPEKSKEEIKVIEKKYYHYLSDQIVETIKLLHISDKEMAKRVKVNNIDAVNGCLEKGRNVVILMAHYSNWEWVQEMCRYLLPEAFMVTIYRPLNSRLWDRIFARIRSRWNAHIVPMNKITRTLLNKDNFPWICGFIADQRTGHKTEANCIDFLHHKTYFIYGPEEIGKKVGADFFYLEMERKRRGYYSINLLKLHPDDFSLPFPYMREFWRLLEKTIIANPPYWLWSHKRWK